MTDLLIRHPELLQKKGPRRVRSAAGMKRYRLPMGAPIRSRRTMGEAIRQTRYGSRLLRKLKDVGGFTCVPASDVDVKSGYSVAVAPTASLHKRLDELKAGDIDAWMRKYAGTFTTPGTMVGGWHDTSTGEVWLDIVEVIADRDEAIERGKAANQIAIFDLDTGTEIDTGGTGLAKAKKAKSKIVLHLFKPGTSGAAILGAMKSDVAKKRPRDADADNLIYEGTPRERPAGPKAPDLKRPKGLPRRPVVGGRRAPRTTKPKPKRQTIVKPPEQRAPGEDTMLLHSDGRGNWSPERTKLHDAIVMDLLKGHKKSETPEVLFLGGGPASGKSTILPSLDVPDGVTIDSDHIKGYIPEYQEMVEAGDKTAASYAHEESSHLGKRTTSEALSTGLNVTLDGTGDSSIDKLRQKVQEARDAGHAVRAAYVTVDTEVAVQRSNDRGAKTGRLVPEAVVREIHGAVTDTFIDAITEDLFDSVDLWDTNGDGEPLLVGQKALGGSWKVIDKKAWERFVAKGSKKTAKAKPKPDGTEKEPTMNRGEAAIRILQAVTVGKTMEDAGIPDTFQDLWDEIAEQVEGMEEVVQIPSDYNLESAEGDQPEPEGTPKMAKTFMRHPELMEKKRDKGHSSRVHPGLDRKPGNSNWVDAAGGLPSFIERIAKHLHYDKGMSIGHAIATAVNQCKKWAAGGKDVSPATRAKAAKAIAQWEAKKVKSKAKTAARSVGKSVELAEANVAKYDEDKRLVFGWAYVTHDPTGSLNVDKSGEYVDEPEELEEAAYGFVLKSREGDVDHTNVQTSTLVESICFTPEKIAKMGLPEGVLPTGWWVGFKVHDEEVWKNRHKYTSFSIYGSATKSAVPDGAS